MKYSHKTLYSHLFYIMMTFKFQHMKKMLVVIRLNLFPSAVNNMPCNCHVYVPYRQVDSRAGVFWWILSRVDGELPGRRVGTPEKAGFTLPLPLISTGKEIGKQLTNFTPSSLWSEAKGKQHLNVDDLSSYCVNYRASDQRVCIKAQRKVRGSIPGKWSRLFLLNFRTVFLLAFLPQTW